MYSGCAEALSFLGVSSRDIHWISTSIPTPRRRTASKPTAAVSFLQAEVMAAASKEVRAKVLDRVAPLLDATLRTRH